MLYIQLKGIKSSEMTLRPSTYPQAQIIGHVTNATVLDKYHLEYQIEGN